MKAIIIAAGVGSRLLPLTKETPKSMLPVKGKPLLHYSLERLLASGITDISIIIGHVAEKIKENVPCPVKFYETDYRKNSPLHALFAATQEMVEAFICLYADILYEQNVLKTVLDNTADIRAIVDIDWKKNYVGRVLHPEAEAEKVVLLNGDIQFIGKYLSVEQAHGEFIGIAGFSDIGAHLWRETFLDVLKKYKPNSPFQHACSFQQAALTDLFQEIIDRGHTIQAALITGKWQEIDTIEDYIRAGGDRRP